MYIMLHQYLTEVHYVNSKGEDAGVVFSEQMSKEHNMDLLVNRLMRKYLYPEGHPYSFEAGGIASEIIKDSGNISELTEYRRKYFHLNNMLITITGAVNDDELIDKILQLEREYFNRIPVNFIRPFQTKLPPIRTITREESIPYDEEKLGMCQISWRGPPGSSVYHQKALCILFQYMHFYLVQHLIDVKHPYCTSIDITLTVGSDCEITATLYDVPAQQFEYFMRGSTFYGQLKNPEHDQTSEIRKRFFQSISLISESEEFNIKYLHSIMDNETRNFRETFEENLHSFVAGAMKNHHLYATSLDINQYSTRTALGLRLQEYEKMVEARKNRLGVSGLEEKARRYRTADEENKRNKPTPEVIRPFILKSVEFNTIQVNRTIKYNWPINTTVYNLQSDFIESYLFIDTMELPKKLRKFLPLFKEIVFNSNKFIDGDVIPIDDIVQQSSRDLISATIFMGVENYFQQFATLKLRVVLENYNKLSEWSNIFIKQISLDLNAILAGAGSLADNGREDIKSRVKIGRFLMKTLLYENESYNCIFDNISSQKLHIHIANIEDEQQEVKIIDYLQQIIDYMSTAPKMLKIAGNFDQLEQEFKSGSDWNFLRGNSSIESQRVSDIILIFQN
uniref:Peptidase M16 C-terminal domain-containing protein n=2 Tax=Meloidogyne TaxID=189290 RepID=A0A915NKJ2_9BILA